MQPARTHPVLMSALVVVCGLLAYTTWRFHEQVVGLNNLLGQARQSINSDRSTIARLSREDSKAHIQSATAAPEEQAGKRDGKAATTNRQTLVDAWLALLNDPKLLALTSAKQRALITSRYGPLFKKMGLSDELSQRMTGLLVSKRNASLDVAASAQASGLADTYDRDTFKAAVKIAESDIDTQIASLLGTTDYSEYQQYEQQMVSGQIVQRVQGLLDGSPDSLSTDQQQLLQSTMAQLGAQSVTRKVLSAAQSFLTPGQMQALSQIRQQEIQTSQISSLQGQYQQASGSLMPLPVPK